MRRVLIASLLTLALAGCNLETPPPTPVPTPDLPRVEFLYPENDARVIEGTDLTIDIVARDETLGIQKIELYLNSHLLNQATPDWQPESIYRVEMNWFANSVGYHVLSAIAYRPDGARSDEAIINIEVIAP